MATSSEARRRIESRAPSPALGALRGLAVMVAACIGIVAGAYGALVFCASDASWVEDITRSALSEGMTLISYAPNDR